MPVERRQVGALVTRAARPGDDREDLGVPGDDVVFGAMWASFSWRVAVARSTLYARFPVVESCGTQKSGGVALLARPRWPWRPTLTIANMLTIANRGGCP
jgi:hypothetical protein